MTISSENFIITDFDFKFVTSKLNNEKILSGINSATVFCKKCEYIWLAREYGEGKLKHNIGNTGIKCPSCNTNESVSNLLFFEK